MTFRFAAVLPLLLAGCTQPVPLPDAGALTRAAAASSARPAPAGPTVAYTPRPITEPGDWRQLNDAQAPGGSS